MATYNKEKRKEELYANATSAPTIKKLPVNPTYDDTSWDSTQKGKDALDAYNTAKENVLGQPKFNFSNNEWLKTVLGDIKDFKDFSYDINGDALYQQYKDKYIQQGKMAMMDTIGQAAAMTGGYGNSYAQSVGQQVYQGQLDNLNDIVPELYQQALNKYSMDKQNLYDQYGLLLSEYEREYGLHSDEYNKLLDALGIAKDDYYSGADMFYTEQSNKNDVLGKTFSDEMAIWGAETDELWNQAEWDEGLRQYIEGVLYQEGRDAVEDEQWQTEFDEAKRQFNAQHLEDMRQFNYNYKAKQDSSNNNTTYVPPKDEEEDEEPGFKAVESRNVDLFKSAIRTKNEFYGRSSPEKEKYKTYEAYIEGKIDEWLTSGKVNEDEAATLIAYYGLA